MQQQISSEEKCPGTPKEQQLKGKPLAKAQVTNTLHQGQHLLAEHV